MYAVGVTKTTKRQWQLVYFVSHGQREHDHLDVGSQSVGCVYVTKCHWFFLCCAYSMLRLGQAVRPVLSAHRCSFRKDHRRESDGMKACDRLMTDTANRFPLRCAAGAIMHPG